MQNMPVFKVNEYGVPTEKTMQERSLWRPSQPLPLVLILEEINFGGAQRQMIELLRHVDRKLFTPEIWTLRAGDELLDMAIQYDIIVHILCPNDAELVPLHAIKALWKELYKRRPPIIHCHTTFPNIWGRILGRLLRIPVIIGSIRSKRNIRKQKERYSWPLSHLHICNANSLYEDLLAEGLKPHRLYNIVNGVDIERFKPAVDGLCKKPHIITVGRLVKEKNLETFFTAFKFVCQHVPDAHLHMVGDGYLMDMLLKLVVEMGIDKNITFHGAQADIRPFVHNARLFGFSSVDEGTPNAILEAMAMGLPIVSTNVDGIPAMVEHGKHGYLFDAYDSKAMGEYMLEVLTTDNLAEDMGDAARKRTEDFYSLELMARRHEAVYGYYYQKNT